MFGLSARMPFITYLYFFIFFILFIQIHHQQAVSPTDRWSRMLKAGT